MLVSAPLFTAQIDLHKAREALKAGDQHAIQNLNLASRGTAGEFMKALSQAAPLNVLK